MRNDQLQAEGLKAGPWLHDLKMAVLRQRPDELISPDAERTYRAEDLARKLLIQAPGEKIAYGTDFADTPDNIRKMTELAQGAHTLFCEASFMAADEEQARLVIPG